MSEPVFNDTYYTRYYVDPKSRVAEPTYFENLARFIASYARLLDIRIRTIVDLGCGIGTLKKPLLKRFPKATYVGVDVSEYACEKYGWEHSTISDYWSPNEFDLVVCHDVVQYLEDQQAKAAIRNFDTLCGGLLYFSVLTEEDYLENCDKSRTDSAVHLRTAQWYRRRTKPLFRNLGGGVYIGRDSDVAVYALEHLDA
ncbi:MAG: class I SAM-dependent methyltransferase [Gammaproteobacteria bacterium]